MNSLKEAVIDELITREGGYVNDPTDRGGETMYGITEKVARLNGYTGLMKYLPYELAFSIYEKRYWHTLKLDCICQINKALTLQLFDFGVNSGISAASKSLQKTLNVLNKQGAIYQDLSTDGILGSQTLIALNKFIEHRKKAGLNLLSEIVRGQRISFCIDIALNDESQEKYQYGWLKRIVHL